MPDERQLEFLEARSDGEPDDAKPEPPTPADEADDAAFEDDERWEDDFDEGTLVEPLDAHRQSTLSPSGEAFEDDGQVLPTLPWLSVVPSIDALTRHPRLSRMAGAILGAAIGDAIGHPTEFIGSFSSIHAKYGPQGVTGYELYWTKGGKRFAPYTDDTQMAEVVLRTLLWANHEEAGLDATMRKMAEGFVRWADAPQGGHRAPGNACMSGCRALAQGVHWSRAGGEKAGGCGSVMRAYPFGLVFSSDLARAERWAVAHSRLTHRDPIALAACAAMAIGMARILRDDPLDVVLSEMVAAACRHCAKTAAMMCEAIDDARSGVPPTETLDRLRAWAAHEAIAAAVYLLARHPDDPRTAILEGANTPGDSDSIATLAGALVGARTGVAALPAAWVADLERAEVFSALAGALG
jgi:ADP-ribosylglycohydrolase